MRYSVKGKFVPVHIMKAYRVNTVDLHSFITSALDGNEGQNHVPVALLQVKDVFTY